MRLYNEDALALISEWGTKTSEVFLTSFSEYEPSFAKMLVRKKGELPVNSVHVLNTQFEPQLFSAHPRVKKDAFDWLEKVMESARILGAKHYTFHGLARIKSTFQENLPKAGSALEEIAEFCNAYGVKLCLENVEWALYNRPGIFTQLKQYCPQLGSVLDIKQARLTKHSVGEYMEEMGKSLAYVHVSDADESGKMCLPGKGTFDFDEFFRKLSGIGFDGAVILESYDKDYGELKELKDSYEFLAEKAEKYRLQ